jgi:hypothetical protein
MVRIVDANGIRVNMIDGAGNLVDRYRTSTADGSFRFQLSTPTPSLPLLVQVAGVDGTGTPVVIHSTLNTTTLPQIVNVTPATEAVVAQVLGASPRSVFANAATVWPSMALMGSTTAVTSASNQIKTVIAANLTDAKISDTKNLDFFRDETFLANKLGLDAALEGLRIQIVKDSIGRDQLQLGNKLLTPGVVEVKIDLATARTELAKGASGVVTKAISSTLKVTTSPNKTGLPNLATLDDLSTAVNKMVAQGANAATFLASPVLTSHTFQDGRSRVALADILAGYATRNNQLGRWQVMGCVELPVPTTGCTKVSVSTLVSDRSGNVVDVLADTVGYNASVTPSWVFVGNARSALVKVHSVAQASFNLDGVAQVGTLAPANGIQVLTRAVDYAGASAQAVQSAVIQVPSGYSVLYKYCGMAELCITPNASLSPVATGELKDTQLQKPAPGWLGSQDAARGAKFVASVTLMGTATDTVTPYLMSDLALDLSTSLFPKPDASLSTAAMVAGGAVNWANWANANPDMRMLSLRLITTSPAGTAQIADYPLTNPFATTLTLPATATASSGFQLWMIALDALGRRYYSQFNSAF